MNTIYLPGIPGVFPATLFRPAPQNAPRKSHPRCVSAPQLRSEAIVPLPHRPSQYPTVPYNQLYCLVWIQGVIFLVENAVGLSLILLRPRDVTRLVVASISAPQDEMDQGSYMCSDLFKWGSYESLQRVDTVIMLEKS